MYQCPNCGGNLKFDIPSQKMLCDYCHTSLSPYEVSKEQDAEETRQYDVTVFTCPQCGGEIISTETSAAEFCSFCGASTILSSRISKEKRPNYIIPFMKTKEDCKVSYRKWMRRALFAPKELKDPKFIDNFRGIYMPFWIYDVSQYGNLDLQGKKEYRRGDYVYTDYYSLRCLLDAEYLGLSYDASSSFSDDISEALAPYDINKMQDFTPSYLSGFYADTADVEEYLYERDAEGFANQNSYEKVVDQPKFRSYDTKKYKDYSGISGILHTENKKTESAMFPVWFLAYRKGDRISYATVNGMTGKVAADLPIDPKKYALGSLLLALPIYFLLDLFLTLRPNLLVIGAAVLAVFVGILYYKEINLIQRKEAMKDDRGYQSRITAGGKKKRMPHKTTQKIYRGYFGILASVLIAVALIWFHPVSDYYYYAGTIVSFGGIFYTICSLIQQYNLLATRRLPQFDRSGGDDRA